MVNAQRWVSSLNGCGIVAHSNYIYKSHDVFHRPHQTPRTCAKFFNQPKLVNALQREISVPHSSFWHDVSYAPVNQYKYRDVRCESPLLAIHSYIYIPKYRCILPYWGALRAYGIPEKAGLSRTHSLVYVSHNKNQFLHKCSCYFPHVVTCNHTPIYTVLTTATKCSQAGAYERKIFGIFLQSFHFLKYWPFSRLFKRNLAQAVVLVFFAKIHRKR